MKKLLLIPLLLFCVTAFGQWTKPQLYSNINTNIRLKTYSPTRMAALLDSLVATMNTSSFTLSSGNGTTVGGDGTSVDLGGTITGIVNLSSSDAANRVNLYMNDSDNSGTFYTNYSFANDAFTSLFFRSSPSNDETYEANFYTGDGGFNYKWSGDIGSTGSASRFHIGNGYGTDLNINGLHFYADNANYDATEADLKFRINNNGQVTLNLGSDATGDIYYRNSSGYFTRLAAGTNGHVLTLAAGIPSWAAPSGGGSLSGLTAATGSNTINNAANAQEWQWNTLGAGTGLLLSSSSTAAASNTNTLFRVNQTGANATSTQTTYSGYLSNTKTGTSSTNVGLYSEASGGTTNLAVKTGTGSVLIGNALSDAITANTRLDVRGTGTSTELIQRWASSTNNQVLSVTNQGQISLSPSGGVAGLSWGGQAQVGSTSNGTSFTNNGTGIFIYGSVSTTSNNILTVSNNANLTATSGTQNNIMANVGFAPTSGTAAFNGYRLTSTINQTGGANGQITFVNIAPTLTAAVNATGFDYNPTVTSVTGTHLSFRATSGKALFGGSTITANTYYDFRGGSSTDKILRLADGSDNEFFTFKANKEYEVTQTNAKYQERQSTGTTAATSFSEIIYSSSDISDGQSVTIEVLWTAKDSGANTGAGGIFYTTWTKASGTLAKAGDNQLVTNDNMTGTWTVSTSDSSGSIQLDFAGVGVANTEISFSTRIIKTN